MQQQQHRHHQQQQQQQQQRKFVKQCNTAVVTASRGPTTVNRHESHAPSMHVVYPDNAVTPEHAAVAAALTGGDSSSPVSCTAAEHASAVSRRQQSPDVVPHGLRRWSPPVMPARMIDARASIATVYRSSCGGMFVRMLTHVELTLGTNGTHARQPGAKAAASRTPSRAAGQRLRKPLSLWRTRRCATAALAGSSARTIRGRRCSACAKRVNRARLIDTTTANRNCTTKRIHRNRHNRRW
jgi:hypothetical protein